MRPGETQIVIRHELRAGSSSDPITDVRGQFIAAQLRPFVHLGRSILTLGDAIEIVGVAEDI